MAVPKTRSPQVLDWENDKRSVVGYRPISRQEYEKLFGNGVLKGQHFNNVFNEAAKKYNMNAGFLAAVAAFETGWGRSNVIRTKNNTGGISGPDGSPRHFSRLEESIEAQASLLDRRYIKKGLTTVAAIGEVYAPPNADNDPNGTNGLWPSTVAGFVKRLSTNIASAVVDAVKAAGKTFWNGVQWIKGLFSKSDITPPPSKPITHVGGDGVELAKQGFKGAQTIAQPDVTIKDAQAQLKDLKAGSHIFANLGTQEALSGAKEQDVRKNIKEFLKDADAKGVQVTLGLPGNAKAPNEKQDAAMKHVGAWLTDEVLKHNKENNKDPKHITSQVVNFRDKNIPLEPDGLKPTPAGYKKMGEVVAEQLKSPSATPAASPPKTESTTAKAPSPQPVEATNWRARVAAWKVNVQPPAPAPAAAAKKDEPAVNPVARWRTVAAT